ncbi:MAG TPA: hypothetical protein VLT45_12750 [Kofleriaceae bacterium]|nr:hypothetical protein [Kofleriaceae bacterium]
MNLDAAIRELYQAPVDKFVAERKRLAKELDKADGKVLLAKRRPTISAWAVNQLWWHARDAFDRMMKTADELRAGKQVDKQHREAIATLRARASTILGDAGHAPTEAVLRRVTTTLSALAAAGTWEPSPPGALADDLDPPGFGAVGLSLPLPAPAAAPKPHHTPKSHAANVEHTAPKIDHAAERRAREEAQRKERERAKKRSHLDAQLAKAKAHVESAEEQLAKARDHVTELERARRDLD